MTGRLHFPQREVGADARHAGQFAQHRFDEVAVVVQVFGDHLQQKVGLAGGVVAAQYAGAGLDDALQSIWSNAANLASFLSNALILQVSFLSTL